MQIDQPTLKTKRLTLRPYAASDRDDIFDYASSDEVARYVMWPAHKTIEDSQKFLDLITSWTCREVGKIFFVFAIELNGKVIGSVDFKNVFPHSAQSFCAVQNVGSSRVMEKIGMQREGLRRKHMMLKGEPIDIADYAVLRS